MTVDTEIQAIKQEITSTVDSKKKVVLYDQLEELLEYKARLRQKKILDQFDFDYEQSLIDREYEI